MTTTRRSPTQSVLLVTGGAGGIGHAVVERARQRSDHCYQVVVAWDIRAAPDITAVDVTDARAVTAALDDIEHSLGPVTALIHTAGALVRDRPTTVDPAVWRQLLTVNTVGTATVCGTVAARMAARHTGSIVGITSNAASTPRIDMAAYAASKAAATSYLRSLGLEVASFGVRVNTVSPGSTMTSMLTGGEDPHDSAVIEQVEKHMIAGTPEQFRLGIPLQRVATPDDIAEACLWLVSDAARHVTMHDLRVDGGATLDGR